MQKVLINYAIIQFIVDQQIKGNSPKTVIFYNNVLKKFSRFYGENNVNDITLAICKQYYFSIQQEKLTATTVQSYIRGLRVFLSWLYENEYITEDITKRFKLPKSERKVIDVLTDEEIHTLLSTFNTSDILGIRNKCIISLMLDSGLRMNEVVTMKQTEVHAPEGYAIVTGKGNKQRYVPLGNHTKKLLLRYMIIKPNIENKALFVETDTITPITITTVKQLFRKLKKKTNIQRLHAHLLRHTFATRYLENGGDIYSLQMILGHTSLEMVKKYVHLTNSKNIVNFTTFSPIDRMTKK